MTNYTIDNKIYWSADLKGAQSYTDIVLPSIVKLIQKHTPQMESIFGYNIEPITETLFSEIFIPCYKKHVVSKSSFYLKEEERYAILREQFYLDPDIRYYLLWVYSKHDSSIVHGATLYKVSTQNNTLAFVHKGYDHKITREMGLKLSFDYWTESIIQTKAFEWGCSRLSHGKDKHFRPNPGLHLFKLKVGTRPMSGIKNTELVLNRDGLESIIVSQAEIEAQDFAVFFDNLDEKGFYQSVQLFYREESQKKDLLLEFQKVANQVSLEVHTTIW